jgi:N-acetylglucosaminyl-diphospho-decaprenol L-rhamnosyltransferase
MREPERLETRPDFSVLIVNFNGGDYVQGALNSLKAQTHRSFEVILLDNASSDGSIDKLDASGLPAFRLVREPENHGFARGNNLAAAQARGTWLALLNPDAAARPDWLAQVLAGTHRHPGVTSFACTQLWMHDETKLDGAGDNYLAFGIPWRGGYRRPVADLPAEGTCFSPCGASAVYHRETFMAAGGYDERLFCFCEDVDLGFRLRLEGEDCVFLPDAVVSHAGGALSEKVSGFAVRYGTRNRLWVYLKCMPLPLLLVHPARPSGADSGDPLPWADDRPVWRRDGRADPGGERSRPGLARAAHHAGAPHGQPRRAAACDGLEPGAHAGPADSRAPAQLTTARSVTRRQLVPSLKARTAPPASSVTCSKAPAPVSDADGRLALATEPTRTGPATCKAHDGEDVPMPTRPADVMRIRSSAEERPAPNASEAGTSAPLTVSSTTALMSAV